MANLNIEICGIRFPNPIFTAAGPGAKDAELIARAVKGGVGGIVTKTISAEPAQVPRPCMAQLSNGFAFINTELWSEHSVEHWVAHEYPQIKALGLPVIVGVGYTAEQLSKVLPLIKPYADMIEMSVHYVGTDSGPMLDALAMAKKHLQVPVFMKMSPHTDIVDIAKKVANAGADGLALINSVGPGMAIDIEKGLPLMGSDKGYGWVSGAAIRPLAVRAIYDVAKEVNLPILGVGGVTNGRDAAELMMAGAAAVQVCTEAILKGPNVYGKIANELNKFLDDHDYAGASDITGLAVRQEVKRHPRKEAVLPVCNDTLCNRCGICKISCVYDAITVDKEHQWEASSDCFGCGVCVSRCPQKALSVLL